MYFNNLKLFSIEENIENNSDIYAHMVDGKNKETLKEHSDLVYNYFLKICSKKDISSVFTRLEDKFLKDSSDESRALFKEIIINSIYMHDIGKINSDFQYIKMKNNRFKDTIQENSNHSMLSAIIYFDYYFEKVKKLRGEECMILLLFLTINSYIISKHHGMLTNFNDFLDRFSIEFEFNKELYKSYKSNLSINKNKAINLMNRLKEYMENVYSKKSLDVDIYIYSKLIFSLLTSCDFYATSHYQSNTVIDDFGTIEDISKYYQAYKLSNIYKGLKVHKKYLNGVGERVFEDNDINKLRVEMNIEAEENLIRNNNKNIYYLEAPTGSGKTITSINLALKSLEINESLNKIFYIFPFNTLVEQTQSTLLETVFSTIKNIKSDIAVINSITPIQTVDEKEDNKNVYDYHSNNKIDYDKSLLNRQFLHYPIILTTHIAFFNYLFGISREESFPLIHLANSVVILDEIQSYKNAIWKEIIIFLEKYAQILNIKIIIMSATLPRLDKLGYKNNNCAYLINDRKKYFNSPLFKNRVEVDFGLLDIDNFSLNDLLDRVKEVEHSANKILIEFIKKSSALEFYKVISEQLPNVMLISGDDNKLERKRIINTVKTQEKSILIATQVIEAGIDIDMDIGFKDISILDSEEQFLGRINRSCKKSKSKVYFFNIDDASTIYRHDFRKQEDLTLIYSEIQDILISKDFEKYYSKVINKIEESKSKFNDDNIDKFINNRVGKLDFNAVKDKMKLIDKSKEYTIFLNLNITLDNGEILVGSEIWNEYKKIIINNKLSYSKKRILLSNIMEKVDFFTYKLHKFTNAYSDCIGDIFYIENGKEYLTEGKFDRSKFGENVDHEFL